MRLLRLFAASSLFCLVCVLIILINPLALTLPPLEVLSGLMLVGSMSATRNTRHVTRLFPQIRRVGALSVVILSAIFCLALLSALLRGIQVDCGCFGGGGPSILKTGLAFGRDMILLVVAILLYRRG